MQRGVYRIALLSELPGVFGVGRNTLQSVQDQFLESCDVRARGQEAPIDLRQRRPFQHGCRRGRKLLRLYQRCAAPDYRCQPLRIEIDIRSCGEKRLQDEHIGALQVRSRLARRVRLRPHRLRDFNQ